MGERKYFYSQRRHHKYKNVYKPIHKIQIEIHEERGRRPRAEGARYSAASRAGGAFRFVVRFASLPGNKGM